MKSPKWFPLLFTVCFMHSVLQERCKFGSLGWTVPYEFNHSDLTASLLFVQKYMYSIQAALKRSGELAWPSIRYMVCEVMYGGRVTDAHDRRLLNAYGNQWLDSKIFKREFRFHDEYAIPDDVSSAKGLVPASVALPRILEHVSALPLYDSPELFGLHINAAQAFSSMSAATLLRGIAATISIDSVSQAAAEDGTPQIASMSDALHAALPAAPVGLGAALKRLGAADPFSVILRQALPDALAACDRALPVLQ